MMVMMGQQMMGGGGMMGGAGMMGCGRWGDRVANEQQPPYIGPVLAHSGGYATGKAETNDVGVATGMVGQDTGVANKEQKEPSGNGD